MIDHHVHGGEEKDDGKSDDEDDLAQRLPYKNDTDEHADESDEVEPIEELFR
jgi:hypothetical protein